MCMAFSKTYGHFLVLANMTWSFFSPEINVFFTFHTLMIVNYFFQSRISWMLYKLCLILGRNRIPNQATKGCISPIRGRQSLLEESYEIVWMDMWVCSHLVTIGNGVYFTVCLITLLFHPCTDNVIL